MFIITKQYGYFTEITRYQRKPNPSKVRVHHPRLKNRIYGKRRPDNIRRTRQICLRRVSAALTAFGRPLLITLTFGGDASDASFANDALRRFQVRLRNKYPLAESLFVPELSPKGRIHFHGLLFNMPMHLGDQRVGRRIISHGTERKTRELAKLWLVGFVDVRQTDGSFRLAFYITKYITKGSREIMFNAMRILRISRGFPHEIVLRDELAEEIERRYANDKPISEWEGQNDYQGKITKKLYLHEDNK